ncbi:hypothetical protein BMR1_02g03255 [Babesia microti strain RI]|uniref:Uncharacterized protein n=1 Tax=Babesia microti (strain RI) TaxID=1133968 RepID=I7JAJ0_BABMR|nr:hypothetical protein BMR1_02g03255 [Babesia microti strain RI]CCF73804.1 hypothetical protein BMR1_02g03255 [Babesia microti strain RI]|eukprot:XP_012648413.1 hypothetical protein BMR1_02g03255 [Babesia microti strain RI]
MLYNSHDHYIVAIYLCVAQIDTVELAVFKISSSLYVSTFNPSLLPCLLVSLFKNININTHICNVPSCICINSGITWSNKYNG